MKRENKNLDDLMAGVANRWDHSGHFILTQDSQVLHHGWYGYENRDKGIKTGPLTRYLMDSKERFFVGWATLMAVDEGVLTLSEPIKAYLPEWPYGDQIHLEDLLRQQSGLTDFYHDHLLVGLENEQGYGDLSEHDQVRREKNLLYENRHYDRVYGIMKNLPLDFQPGTKNAFVETNVVVLDEIIRRVTGTTTLNYLKKRLFVPYGFDDIVYDGQCETLSCVVHKRKHYVSTPINHKQDGLFSMSVSDVMRLMTLMMTQKILSESLWREILSYDEKGQGILFSNVNGYDCTSTQFLGFGIHLYFDFKSRVTFASLINEDQTFTMVDNVWRYFRRDAREAVASFLTFPKDTKMVPVNEKNFWDALSITVRDDQHQFVIDARGSMAMGLFFETKEVFVQMEGEMVVGLLVLEIDQKKEFYHISIIIIDQKFQNKGFGKLMVKWAVNHLKAAGAKKLTIGVDRNNLAAKKVYLNAGFEVKSVYDDGMALEMTL